MISVQNRTIFISGASLLCIFVAAGIYTAQPVLFFSPFLLLLLYFFLQQPLLLFYTLLGSIPWSVETIVTDSLGTDLPDEPLMLLMSFVVMILLIQKRKKYAPHPLIWLLLCTVAWSTVTVITSTHLLLSIKYLLSKTWYLLAFAGAPLLLNGDAKLVKRAALVLFASMFTVTLWSLSRHAVLGFTFATANEAVAPFFRNHVNYSALLVFMVPLLLAFYTLTKRTVLRSATVFSLVIILAAVYFSFARGAWLALFIGLLSYWLLRNRWLLKSFLLFILLIAAGVFWLSTNDRYLAFAPKHDVTIFHQNFSEHLVATYKGRDVSTAERFHRWVAGAHMAGDRWMTGFGPTTFYQHYKSYTVPAFRTWVSDNREQSTVHNYFLLLLAEQGVPGLLLFLLLLAALFWYAEKVYHRTTNRFWKTTVAAIAAILCMQCVLNFLSDLIETDKVGSVFYLCLAFLLIADAKTTNDEHRNSEGATGN